MLTWLISFHGYIHAIGWEYITLSVRPFVRESIYLSVYSSVCPSVHPSIFKGSFTDCMYFAWFSRRYFHFFDSIFQLDFVLFRQFEQAASNTLTYIWMVSLFCSYKYNHVFFGKFIGKLYILLLTNLIIMLGRWLVLCWGTFTGSWLRYIYWFLIKEQLLVFVLRNIPWCLAKAHIWTVLYQFCGVGCCLKKRFFKQGSILKLWNS